MGAATPRQTGSQRYRTWPLLLLWTGPKHSGKTTAAARLVAAARAEGLVVDGFLAPARYEHEQLIGFDLLDLQNGSRMPLARRAPQGNQAMGRFHFAPAPLSYGNDALKRVHEPETDLIVVDEFGPLELAGQGWRHAVDTLLATRDTPLLLVVRQELVGRVRCLYEDVTSVGLPATEPQSIAKALRILQVLRETRKSGSGELPRSASVPLKAGKNSAGQMRTIRHEDV